jgi:hypothetical protein
VESKVLIKSLIRSLFSFVNIYNSPFLVISSVVAPYTNWSSFFILGTSNIEDLVVLPVDELLVLVLEDLPPSRVGVPDLHVA